MVAKKRGAEKLHGMIWKLKPEGGGRQNLQKRDCRKISETKIVYEFPVFKEKRPVKAALPKR